MSVMSALDVRSAPRADVRPLRHRLTRLVEAATTPLLPADYLDLFAPLRSGADLRARVVEVHPETADAATLVLRPGADWAGHVPGQYVRIGVDVDGVRQWRAYSLTHGPRRDGLISITVKAVPDGVVSNHLVHRCQPGTLVHLEQAAGEFVLPDFDRLGQRSGKLLFVTAGSGITPVIGMLRNLFPVTDSGVLGFDTLASARYSTNESDASTDKGSALDVTVLHVAPSEPESIFIDNLKTLNAAGAIKLIARYDDEHGLLDLADLEMLVPDLAERITLACGPSGLLEALAHHHEERGLPLQTEQFRPTLIEAGEGGSVTFARNGVVVEADGATPILDAGESAGVLMPSGCRMGVCFGCVVPLTSGAVRDLRNGEITTAVPGETDVGGVRVQTCINAAAGPCEFDL